MSAIIKKSDKAKGLKDPPVGSSSGPVNASAAAPVSSEAAPSAATKSRIVKGTTASAGGTTASAGGTTAPTGDTTAPTGGSTDSKQQKNNNNNEDDDDTKAAAQPEVLPASGIRRHSAAGVALNLLQIPFPIDRPKSPGLSKLTEFQRKKVDYMFDTFFSPSDDDSVTINDFFRLLKLATNIRQWTPLHQGFKGFQNQLANIWAGLIKGTLVYKAVTSAAVMEITREEWQHYWGDFVEAAMLEGKKWPEKSKNGRVHYQCQKDLRNFIFNVMDVKGDGVIDKDEYKLSLLAFEVPDFDIEDAFEKMSKAAGGFDAPASPIKYTPAGEPVTPTTPLTPTSKYKITEAMFNDLWHQYLTSNIETDTGNCLLGKPLFS